MLTITRFLVLLQCPTIQLVQTQAKQTPAEQTARTLRLLHPIFLMASLLAKFLTGLRLNLIV